MFIKPLYKFDSKDVQTYIFLAINVKTNYKKNTIYSIINDKNWSIEGTLRL